MKLINKSLLSVALGVLGVSWIGSASAVPAFAHKYEKSCSYCHNAWPQLNAKGRKFKEMGYRLKEDLKGDTKDTPYLEGFPIGAILVSRPYDKKSNGEREIHGVHEAEIFIAGAVDKNVSTFIEMEAEDEKDWTVEFGHAILNYRESDAVNVQLSWAPLFFADPYGTIGDHFRPTVSHNPLMSDEGGTVSAGGTGFVEGADGAGYDTALVPGGALGSHRHNIAVNGRVGKFFYIAGISGVAGSVTGEKDSVVSGRLAFDISDTMMVGAFMASGKTSVDSGASEAELSFTRTGIDFMADFGNSRLNAGYIAGKDDTVDVNTLADTGSASDTILSVQATHTYKTEKGKPTWVPVARYESYTKNDGDDKYADLVLGASYFLKENVKAMIEYKTDMDVPSGLDKESRATFQINVGL